MTLCMRHAITAFTAVTALTLVAAGSTQAAPVKEVLSTHFGHEVDKTTKADICTVASKDKCGFGLEGSKPGEFEFPEGVATAANDNIYIADKNNRRIQELKSNGEFVLMFGKDVNKATGGDICTKEEEANCQAGQEGGGPGEFTEPQSVAVDPSTHHVYVADTRNWRVEVFAEDGQFISMFGKGVNETTGSNICSEEEIKNSGVKCGPAKERVRGEAEPDAFKFRGGADLLAVGPEHLLYVGDEGGVKKLKEDGSPGGEIPLLVALDSFVTAIVVDESGNAYLVINNGSVIYKFDPTGKQIGEFPLLTSDKEHVPRFERFSINGLAVDSFGRLAVAENEEVKQVASFFGSLIDDGTGQLITSFTIAFTDAGGMVFNLKDQLYLAVTSAHEVSGYVPVEVAELTVLPATCAPGAEHETDATFDCSLKGDVNPEGVTETEAWLQWGKTASLELETQRQGPIEGSKPVAIEALVQGLLPNETYHYRLAAQDHVVKEEEQLHSEAALLATPIVPPWTGKTGVSFVKSSSAVMSGELNPENARTEDFFEYGPARVLADCPKGIREGIQSQNEEEKRDCQKIQITAVQETSCTKANETYHCVYGSIGTILEATGLQPSTVYDFRLFAEGHNIAGTETKANIGKIEGSFETAVAPKVEARTGASNSVTTTSAVISGMVNPSGQPATYTFELGVYDGTNTQYGVVFSGLVGASTTFVEERLALTGLQPGTTYAYRMGIHSGYGSGIGTPETFTTGGLPAVLPEELPVSLLVVPKIKFPVGKPMPPRTCKRGYKRDKHGKCVKAKSKAQKKKGKKARKAGRQGEHARGKGARQIRARRADVTTAAWDVAGGGVARRELSKGEVTLDVLMGA
jgi:DNA-binding beta-propeller fold protein YncE